MMNVTFTSIMMINYLIAMKINRIYNNIIGLDNVGTFKVNLLIRMYICQIKM